MIDEAEQTQPAGPARISRLDPARIDEVAPLWRQLHRHHLGIATPVEDLMPPLTPEDSWPVRRARYVDWLASPDGFALVAEHDGEPVGYAMARVVDDTPGSWTRGARIGILESLAILPGRRGAGTGTRLLEAVRDELRARGIRDLELAVIAGNEDALRFYRRHGLVPFATIMVGSTDPR